MLLSFRRRHRRIKLSGKVAVKRRCRVSYNCIRRGLQVSGVPRSEDRPLNEKARVQGLRLLYRSHYSHFISWWLTSSRSLVTVWRSGRRFCRVLFYSAWLDYRLISSFEHACKHPSRKKWFKLDKFMVWWKRPNRTGCWPRQNTVNIQY